MGHADASLTTFHWELPPGAQAIVDEMIDALLALLPAAATVTERFLTHGATGSHLENPERIDGFKGFNQQGVSDIINRTDPRRALARSDA